MAHVYDRAHKQRASPTRVTGKHATHSLVSGNSRQVEIPDMIPDLIYVTLGRVRGSRGVRLRAHKHIRILLKIKSKDKCGD